jgi:hypothetical protein
MMQSLLTAKDVRGLMRKHRLTIRDLAQRMQIPMKSIRRARAHGPRDFLASLDLAEAIRGHLTDRERACLRQYVNREL